MTLASPPGHPRAPANRGGDSHLGIGRELPIQGPRTLAMLTISIIFALLVLLWGRIGVPHVDR